MQAKSEQLVKKASSKVLHFTNKNNKKLYSSLESQGRFFQLGRNFLQASRANHFRHRHAFFRNQQRKKQRKNTRGQFFNFVMWPSEESDKVENYRFLENCSMEFAENQGKQSFFNRRSPQIIKNFKSAVKICEFSQLYMCRQAKFSENRFFKILISALLIF